MRVLPSLVADPAATSGDWYSTNPSPSRSPYSVDPFERRLGGRQELLGERDVARPPQVLRVQRSGTSGVESTEPKYGRVRDDPRPRELALRGSRAGSCRAARRASRRSVVPCLAARSSSASRAGRVLTVSSWCEAISASRPKTVTYHGIPAARIAPPSVSRVERPEIAEAAVEQLVEELVVGDDLRRLALPLLVGATELVDGVVEVHGATALRPRRSARSTSPTSFVWYGPRCSRKVAVASGPSTSTRSGRRRELDPRDRGERRRGRRRRTRSPVAHHGRARRRAGLARHAADLEDVGEVRAEVELEVERDRRTGCSS